VHELPAGVLDMPNAATTKQCSELMDVLNEFERLCGELGRNHATLIEGCRWHFEHYAHYLNRRRHFTSYQLYVQERGGPMCVQG
jgi:hypothetical protein